MKKMLRILLLLVNVAVVLLLLASTMAGVVPPSKFEWISLLSYAYFPILLANVVMAVIWLCMPRWEFLLSVAAIVVRFSFIPLYLQFGGNESAPESAEANRITVMDWNVHMFHGRQDSVSFADSNARLFVQLVREEAPDVLTMQEFYEPGHVRVDDSLQALGYKYRSGINTSGSKKVPYGVAIYSKLPINYVQKIDSERKFFVDITKQDAIVRVVCVHLDSYMLTPEDRAMLVDTKVSTMDSTLRPTLNKMRETYKSHEQEWDNDLKPIVEGSTRPLLLCGDFNDTPASYFYQQAKRYLKDSFVEQGSGLFSNTYHGLFPNYRIDYILHSKELKAVSYKRIKNDISDHYAIVSTFEL